ncbi:MAG: S8 family peptidase [Saprospiraceae bacterium]|nr:S8 family peptidase [Saprospiraceae bacterium]
MNLMKKGLGLVAFFALSFTSYSQDKLELIDWHLRDLSASERGISLEKAYDELLNNASPKEQVIVAVIDSGIDIEHEDLKSVIWTNEDEIPGNGKDDDNNGYIDDVHGWNFLGNANGDMVGPDNLEVARLYKHYHSKFGGKMLSEVSDAEKAEWKAYQRVKNEFEEGKLNAQKGYDRYEQIQTMYDASKKTIQEALGKETFTPDDVAQLEVTTPELGQAKGLLTNLYDNGFTEKDLAAWEDYVTTQAKYYYNEDIDSRKDIIKDDADNLYETGYGNPKVSGTEPDHGTHVAGIIAAVRDNGIGMNGVANHVWIMPIRTVPKGDEHDKDVANAIRYAVDNGARVVNMSFGKSHSPHEKIVAEAIQYAEDKGVLLVHAAGNDGNDLDTKSNYPTNYSSFIKGKVKTYLTVGASSINSDEAFPATFTNYGEKKVDVFAPGVDIYSTYPGDNYEYNNGTSMAAPVVSGIAALMMSYYPDLSAKQVKKIIEKSAVRFDDSVNLPGSGDAENDPTQVEFDELSRTAGLVNAYNALKMAAKKSKY